VHASVRHLLHEGERDGARAGAEVDHHRGRLVLQRVHGPAGELLGLGPRHEHARPDLEVDEPEGGAAGEVLQRHAAGAGRDHLEVGAALQVVRAGCHHEEGARHAGDVCEQQLGVDAR
jgi:hypothetical protein